MRTARVKSVPAAPVVLSPAEQEFRVYMSLLFATASDLDRECERAADELQRVRSRFADVLADMASRAAEDVERVKSGGRPWYSPGQYARTAVEADVLHAQLDSARDTLVRMRRLALKSAPESHAAVAFALVYFLTGGESF